VLVLVLFLVGVAFIYVELFLPGGVFGIIGAAAFIASIVFAFRLYGTNWGLGISVAELLVASVLILYGLKRFPQSRAGKILILGRSLDKKLGYSGTDDHEKYVGMEGETITHLRPAGMAKIDSKRMDVVTEGTFIEKGKRIKVVAVEGNRVVVREIENIT
jgi:membrane-bound serine protease (ClpP class)